MDPLQTFCRQVRARSNEHRIAMALLSGRALWGSMISILRQELDSMVRVIYLLTIQDRSYRKALIEASVNGEPWRTKGKRSRITDKEMTDIANGLHGWTKSVYRFGCAFIHLSSFHDYSDRDPLQALPSDERSQLLLHLQAYHCIPFNLNSTLSDIAPAIPRVLDKISENLDCYLRDLENNKDIDRD